MMARMAKTILIFPAGMPRALAYLEQALTEGQRVIGSSSLGHDPAREAYPEWAFLPYVSAPDFNESLRRLIAEFGIDGIFTPNPVVWDYLHRSLQEISPEVVLVNTSPVASEVAPYQKAMQFAASILATPLQLAASQPKPSISALEIASLFRHAETIPGMCDHEKIRALCEIFRSAPQGDVVEIGSWWGKSAFVLTRLAQCYGVGHVLCVDPWASENLIQNDEQGLIDRIPVDANEAFSIFLINLLPYAHGTVNYLRLPSVTAAAEYQRSRKISTPELGDVDYAGKIAVLHIDGNHSDENARADVAAWASRVMPGGWIVVDDYIWPYGNGPQKAGDEFLRDNADRVELSFVMGSALFIRLRPF